MQKVRLRIALIINYIIVLFASVGFNRWKPVTGAPAFTAGYGYWYSYYGFNSVGIDDSVR